MPIDVTLGSDSKKLPQQEVKRETVETNVMNGTIVDSNPTPVNTVPPSQNNPVQGAPVLDGVVNIPPDAPIVILFGPTSCGKSMALKRLTRHLRQSGEYQAIEPERSFRPSSDTAYQADCDDFNDFIARPTKAAGTTGYMLVNVIEDGNTKCRILEAPGEYYFDPQNPKRHYPNYIHTIIAAQNTRIWCIFVEPNWQDPQDRMNYVARINALKPMMQKNDEVLFIFNKIDETHFVITPGDIRMKQAVDFVEVQYPGIFNLFKNDIPILKWFKKYNCGFVPFQTGLYQPGSDVYADSVNNYPAMLWKAITKLL